MIGRGRKEGPANYGGRVAVLSSLLPGVRAVRAPLAAGFVLLMALWLAVEPAAPTSHTTGIAHSLYRLKGTFSAVGAVGLASFVAYLTGSLYMTMTSGVASSRRSLIIPFAPQSKVSGWRYLWVAAREGVVETLRYSAHPIKRHNREDRRRADGEVLRLRTPRPSSSPRLP
jgi:hypothetical protein